MNNLLITKDDVGLTVWSYSKEMCGTITGFTDCGSYPVVVTFGSNDYTYTKSGCREKCFPGQDLYWSKPEISQPPKPVRTYKKKGYLYVHEFMSSGSFQVRNFWVKDTAEGAAEALPVRNNDQLIEFEYEVTGYEVPADE